MSTTILVWMLATRVISSGPDRMELQPAQFPTAAECQRVAKVLLHRQRGATRYAQCIQMTVIK